MLKRTAVIFGGVFLALGILGFVPWASAYAPDDAGFHALVALVGLFFGFGCVTKRVA
ncbi:MAG TPA: hypothetical protein VF816_00220 [Rhodocyclaceae bacterium]